MMASRTEMGRRSARSGADRVAARRSVVLSPLALALAALFAVSCQSADADDSAPVADTSPSLQSIAVRVHDLSSMVAFYEEAFGASFRTVDTFGLSSRFAEIDGVTLKLVPLRASADFENYPSHQLGFEVDELEAVFEIAERYGGRREGEVGEEDGRRHGAVRDPDGNTIELYERR